MQQRGFVRTHTFADQRLFLLMDQLLVNTDLLGRNQFQL